MRQCPDCKLSGFLSRGSLRSHRRQKHGFVRCECGRTFLKKEYMDQHKRDSRKHQGFLQHKGVNERIVKTGAQGSSISSAHHVEDRDMYGAFSSLSLSAPPSDLYILKRGNLEKFIDDNIQADSSFLRCCGVVINNLVSKLQNKDLIPPKLITRRIVKSGSLGKGTAVKNRSDIDLIMMLRSYDDVDILMGDMNSLLTSLETFLKKYTTARSQRTTSYSVQVELDCHSGHKHDVDILPAVDLLDLGNTPADVYKMMKTADDRIIHEYPVSLSPLQLDIIEHLPTKVKSLIRLVKYWKDEKLKKRDESEMPSFHKKIPGKTNWPNSYALELVVVNAWTKASGSPNFDMIKVLEDVLNSLDNHGQFKIILSQRMKYEMSMLQSRSAPYIMDPSNPYNDMYHGLTDGKAFDWDKVASQARHWLRMPLFEV